ncbi:ATP synthase F1 complex assembly factor 2 [Salpingoeca rosetta]|uniref:ATP synthase F1 complex assembly factor 2 n=1 Tax=Salpingoeca rosetta (strain ATCC 50818 / BSB-021) TaxID=946362 RepID=F2U3P7_SALR5|nr:ATP synthase F1 complex assembly factor 2 [Salpingoeca rosetta]EGD82241.1 ATP synthase F1 complex assembly factor 2 [Salpingoeca rosetta]|eukprot:XP_004996424.1 ATP synthase F1 complex assembly factor 2 [Salpingoeca rosetta]
MTTMTRMLGRAVAAGVRGVAQCHQHHQQLAYTRFATATRALQTSTQCHNLSKTTTSESIKRFYEKASVVPCDGGFQVHLDKRSLKTPKRNTFVVPSEELAHTVAFEWDVQGDVIEPSSMNVTLLCNTAIDNPSGMSHEDRIDNVEPFMRTDTVCFREDTSRALIDMQSEIWDPIVEWFAMRYNQPLMVTYRLDEVQSPEAVAIMRRELLGMTPFELTAYELAADTAKSAVIALALREGAINAQEATAAARLETDFQTSRFGEVEWAHTIEKHDTQARLAASAIVMRLAREATLA